MRVLQVLPSMSSAWGGPPKSVAKLSVELAGYDITSEIVATIGRRVGNVDVTAPGVPIHTLPTDALSRFWTGHSTKLRDFLRAEVKRFDLVVINELWFYGNLISYRYARQHTIPVVQVLHGALNAWRLRQKAIRKWIYRRLIQDRLIESAAAIHAIASAEAERVAELGYETPVIVVPNGIDEEDIGLPATSEVPEPSKLLATYPQLVGRPVILYLGRLHPMKGPDILAKSFVRIAKALPDAVLLVVGPDEVGTKAKMVKALRKADLMDRALFTGLLTGSDKQAAFRCADLFVLPSHSEGFSNALLEALAAGLPVVITENCAFPQVGEHEAGIIVEPEEKAVAEAVTTLLRDADLRARMGKNGRRLVEEEQFTWSAIAKSLAGHFHAILETGKPLTDKLTTTSQIRKGDRCQ